MGAARRIREPAKPRPPAGASPTAFADTPATLFITRKYPPARGGMEHFSYQLYERYPGPKELVALRRGQRWLPVFAMRALVAAARVREHVSIIHLGDALLTPLAPAIARLSGATVVATVHGQDVTRPVTVYQWVLGKSLPALRGRLVAVSEYTAQEAGRRHGVEATVIPNGVDLERFARLPRAADPGNVRRQLSLPETGPLVVSVGRLVPRKGMYWFIEKVMPLLSPDVCLAVAGGGPDGRRVEGAARDDPRVHLLGELSDEAVEDLYSVADAFVAPNVPTSGSPEGFGIAPAEASAAGLPVLASDLEGLREMARLFGVTLVPPGDEMAWAAAVTHAIESERPNPIPVRGWDEVAREYEAFFRSVLQARAQPVPGGGGGSPTPGQARRPGRRPTGSPVNARLPLLQRRPWRRSGDRAAPQ